MLGPEKASSLFMSAAGDRTSQLFRLYSGLACCTTGYLPDTLVADLLTRLIQFCATAEISPRTPVAMFGEISSSLHLPSWRYVYDFGAGIRKGSCWFDSSAARLIRTRFK